MGWLHFLNLQYWYCVIYSLFGGDCTYIDQNGSVQTITGHSGPGFFETLTHSISSGASALWHIISTSASFIWHTYSAFAWGASLFLSLLILFAFGGLLLVRLRELSLYGTLPPRSDEENVRKSRWQELLGEAIATDPKRWRFAILEADKMLGELLEKLGYQGTTTADRMRALPEDAFVTVPVAWEAHRVRNFVSQGSSDFILTQREAFRVMKLYEQVFEEFSFI